MFAAMVVLTGLFRPTLVAAAEPNESLHTINDPIAPTRHHPVTYQVDFRVAVTAPAKTKVLKVWLPIAHSNRFQTVAGSSIETFPRAVDYTVNEEPKYGNRFAYFEFHQPSGAQLISHRFEVTNHQVDWNVDYAKVTPLDASAPSINADPRSQNSSALDEVMEEIESLVAGEKTESKEIGSHRKAAQSLLGAMNWIDKNVVYDHSVASLSADPLHAIVNRRGHCSDYHGLCSTLARKVGFPSRVCYGLQMFDKASPSHCKLEVYLPPYGWVPYDLSETQKAVRKFQADSSLSRIEKEERVRELRDRTFSGFRENSWIEVTRGVHYDLVPAASKPVNVVRTIYAEADGVPLAEPDPSDPHQTSFTWMTIHRVDVKQGQRIRF